MRLRHLLTVLVVFCALLGPSALVFAQGEDVPNQEVDDEAPGVSREDPNFDAVGLYGSARPPVKKLGDFVGRMNLGIDQAAVNGGSYALLFACENVPRAFDFCFNGTRFNARTFGTSPVLEREGTPRDQCYRSSDVDSFYSRVEIYAGDGRFSDVAESLASDDRQDNLECKG